jgi:dTDP-4-amino-4,6-dideoxygalactose transaminase
MHQIDRVEAYWQRRQVIWNRYLEAFANMPLQTPATWPDNERHALHLFTLLVTEADAGISRDDMLSALHKQNIGTGVHYRAIPDLKVYRERYHWRSEDYPHAKMIGDGTLSLPLSAKLTDQDVEDVIAAVANAVGC